MKMQKGFTLIELMIVVAIIAILAAIAISQYQDYVIRSQVSEGSSLADGTKTAVAEWYNNNGNFSATQASYGLAKNTSISGKYVAQVDVSGNGGAGAKGQIVVKFRGASPANKAIYNQYLVFSPTDNGGSLSWKCNSSVGTTVKDKYLPTVCRQ